MLILLISFAAVFGLTASIGLLIFRRDVVLDRLSNIMGARETVSSRLMARQPSVEKLIKPFQNLVPRNEKDLSVLQKRLTRAGYRQRSAINMFYGAKVLVPLGLAFLVTASGVYEQGAFFFYAIALGVGFLLPDFWLGNRIKARQRKIRLGLPEALDLMVVCTEAGLGLDQTVYRVALEMKLGQPEIADELILVNLEQKAGRPRDEALRSFADRANLDSVRALVNTLIQAESFGTSVSKTLRVYSDTLRTQRRQQAEELAAKTTVKLVFPLVLFIFPSIFLVALGPAGIKLFEGFAKYFAE